MKVLIPECLTLHVNHELNRRLRFESNLELNKRCVFNIAPLTTTSATSSAVQP